VHEVGFKNLQQFHTYIRTRTLWRCRRIFIKEMKYDTFSWSIILSYTSKYLTLETDWDSDRNWLEGWCPTML